MACAPLLDEPTLTEYETDVVEALAELLDCTFSDASGIASLYVDLIEAGYEEREHPGAMALEIRAQSDAGGVPQPVQQQQGCALRFELVAPGPRLAARRSDEARSRTRARARARKDMMGVLVDAVAARAVEAAETRPHAGGASVLLARAQARADGYAEILEPIVTAWAEGTDDDAARAVAAVCESLLDWHLGASA